MFEEKLMFFRLKSNIYATYTDNGIIILDAKQDEYFSLTDEAAEYFIEALSKEYYREKQNYIHFEQLSNKIETANSWLQHFLEQNFIEPCEQKDISKVLNRAVKSAGLADYRWDTKDKFVSLSQSPKLLVMQLLFLVMTVDIILKCKGISGIFTKIKKYKSLNKTFREPKKEEIDMLSSALDVACSLYPQKMFCLSWASVFVLIALKKGWKCNLVIGVQSPPFYAHAWAQAQDQVINDAQIVKESLSILFNEPFNQG